MFRYVHANDRLNIDKSHVPETVPYKMMNLAQMQEQLMQMTVLGDPILEAGKTIVCNVPKITSQTGLAQQEPQMSGKWLISKTQHVIQRPEVRPRYLTNLECIKGAYEESVGGAQQSSSATRNITLPTPSDLASSINNDQIASQLSSSADYYGAAADKLNANLAKIAK